MHRVLIATKIHIFPPLRNIKKSAKGKNVELLLEKSNILNKPDVIILELSDEESRNVNDKEKQ